MVIDIMRKPAGHCWVVCMDALEVNFNSLDDAQAFVGQLKARIDAPHVWPIPPSRAAISGRVPDRRTACPKYEPARADLVE